MIDDLEDDELDEQPRIARPPAPSAIPPLTLRGIGAPAASAAPEPGSTEEPESRGLASRTTPRPIASSSPLEERTTADQGELGRLQKTGSGISQIAKAHPIAGGILRGLNTAGSILGAADPFARSIMPNIPGTEEHHNQLVNRQQGRIGEDLGEAKETAATGEATARTDQATAAAEKDRADAEKARNAQPPAKEEKWGEFPGFTDTDGTPLIHESNSGQVVRASDKKPPTGFQPAKPAVEKTPNDFEQYYHDYLTDNNLPDSAHNRLMARKQFAAAGQAPQHEPRQLVIGPDGKVIELHPGDVVPQGSKTVTGDLTNKPTADEQRRADLAENMNENLNQLEGILQRRPELFGPLAGRLTGLRETVGTSDPDVAALKTIEEQLGMAMVGAHAMRNAQHVETAARAITNSFHNEPTAIKSAIDTARKSLTTFQGDVGRDQNRGAQTTSGGGQGGELKPPKDADPGMKWQHRTTNGKTEWRQVKQ